jgi:hypothetical protein
MRRRALVVGINNYSGLSPLGYAEHDAAAIARRLNYDDDESTAINFQVRTLLDNKEPVTRARLRAAIHDLFADSTGLDLAFYFAGHGSISHTGGFLVTADGMRNDYGITMDELTNAAQCSQASSVLLMLDCCHAGAAGDVPGLNGASQRTLLRENMTIMAASLPMQEAAESAEGGLFTAALRDALDGAAADILGEITVASLYSAVEKRFSLWQQQPVAKSYMTRPIVLRKVKPRLSRQELRRVVEFFPTPGHRYQMQSDNDPERDTNGVARTHEDPDKVEIGRLFKRYRDAALINASIPGEDLYYVAQRSHTVELTLFGREYWRMVKERRV